MKRMQLKDLDETTRNKILEMAQNKEISDRKIAGSLGVSRSLVGRAKQEAGLPENTPTSHQSLLDPYKEYIITRVAEGLTTTRILREIRSLGYSGGRTILGELAGELRAKINPSRGKVKRRFETYPGAECQIDWSPVKVLINEKPVKIHVLGIVLSHSRKLFCAVFQNEQTSTLLDGLAIGFTYFSGCPVRCVFDNMTTVTLGRIGRDRKPIWNERFIEFARHYGFEPYLCAVRDPDRKGKIEKTFRLIQDDFLKGTSFSSWEDLQKRLKIWLDYTPNTGNLRIHGTTGIVPNEAFLQEKNLLIALPEKRFATFEETTRSVDADSTISVKSIRYSVPSVLANKLAVVRLFAEHFEVFDTHGKSYLSRKYHDKHSDPRRLVIDKTHYAGLKRKAGDGFGQRIDEAFIKRFPSLQPLVDGIKTQMKSIAPIHINHLIRLADRYGSEKFLAAATRAQSYRSFNHYAVERILRADHPIPPDEVFPASSGIGPTLLGDVDSGDINDYSDLDTTPETRSEGDDK